MRSVDEPVAVAMRMFVGFTGIRSWFTTSVCNKLFDAPVSTRQVIFCSEGGKVTVIKNNFLPTFMLNSLIFLAFSLC